MGGEQRCAFVFLEASDHEPSVSDSCKLGSDAGETVAVAIHAWPTATMDVNSHV